MPRLSKSLPTYRLHKTSGQAIVTLSGRRLYLGKHNTSTSRAEYDRLVSEWLAAGRQLPIEQPAPSLLTVTELCLRYLAHARTYYRKNGKPTSELRDILLSLKPLRRLYGKLPAKIVGPKRLKAVRQAMIRSDLSRKVINQRIGRIKRMFRWAVEEELITRGVVLRLDRVAGLKAGRCEARETEPIKPIADDRVAATLIKMPPIPADMVRVQRLTGARPDEVCQMRPCDIDRSGEVWEFAPASHKTQHHGKQRLIMIGPEAQKILGRYLNGPATHSCFSPSIAVDRQLKQRAEKRKTPLKYGNRPGTNRKDKPTRKPGEAYSVASYRRAIHRACDLAFPHAVYGSIDPSRVPAADRDEYKQWQSSHRWSPKTRPLTETQEALILIRRW